MMKSLQISLALTDGGALYLAEDARGGRELMEVLFGYADTPPPVGIRIRAVGADGTSVLIIVPVDERDEAHILVEGKH